MPKGQSASSSEPLIPKLIVGLGNPEPKYDRTRHNIGFEVLDELAKVWGISLSENRRFNALAGEGRSPFGKIYLLKPLTYMNRSGQAIRAAIDWYKLPPESVLTIYDDMDLPLGRLRLRAEGSSGGHRGLESIEAQLGTREFARLRGGVGRPAGDREAADHVLDKFVPEERPGVARMVTAAAEAVEAWWRDGWEAALPLGNRKVEA